MEYHSKLYKMRVVHNGLQLLYITIETRLLTLGLNKRAAFRQRGSESNGLS